MYTENLTHLHPSSYIATHVDLDYTLYIAKMPLKRKAHNVKRHIQRDGNV